jgi:hypothetical protein
MPPINVHVARVTGVVTAVVAADHADDWLTPPINVHAARVTGVGVDL